MIRVTLNDRLAVSYKTQHTLSYDLANDLDIYLRAEKRMPRQKTAAQLFMAAFVNTKTSK